jgi:glucose-6-phosphate-specific signal transduction histidine kinase
MKGLLYKDFRLILKDYRTFLIISVVFILMGAIWREGLYGPVYGMFFLATVVSTLQNYDEAVGFRRYCEILPITRVDVVNEKYLLSVILVFAGVLLYALVSLVLGHFSMIPETALAMIAVGLLASALSLPFSILFGTQKGSLVLMGIIAMMVMCGMFLINGTEDILVFLSSQKLTGLFFGVLILVLFEISRRITGSLYMKKDL